MSISSISSKINTFRPRRNGTISYEDCYILIQIWLKFITNGLIENMPVLVQIMAWCGVGDYSHCLNGWWHSLALLCVTRSRWGRVTHTCVSKLTIICSDHGLAPSRRQAIIWTNAGILLIGHLGTNISEILIHFHSRKCTGKRRLENGDHLVLASLC